MGRTYRKVAGIRKNSFSSSKSLYHSAHFDGLDTQDVLREEEKARKDREKRERRTLKGNGFFS